MATVYTFPYRCVAEVSLSRLVRNLVMLRNQAGVEVIPVVKGDAYGHGLHPIARALVNRGCAECLAVATLEEALDLRKQLSYVGIIVLSGFFSHQIEAYRKYRLIPMIHSLSHLRSLVGHPKLPVIHLEVDTGMNRLGIAESELPEAIRFLQKLPEKLSGLSTHFAESESVGSSFTDAQLRRFDRIHNSLRESRILATDAVIHVANSAGVLTGKTGSSNAVRVGLSLYGISPNPNLLGSERLLPVLEWKTRVLALRDLNKGETVGYARTYRAKKRERLAVLPVGYADGYPRQLGNCASVIIQGRRAPLRGIVSMDLISVDVSDIPGVREGTVVTLIGRNGREEIGTWELAKQAGTIPYEILCGLSGRVSRLYFE